MSIEVDALLLAGRLRMIARPIDYFLLVWYSLAALSTA
jgi:hypothetical protein